MPWHGAIELLQCGKTLSTDVSSRWRSGDKEGTGSSIAATGSTSTFSAMSQFPSLALTMPFVYSRSICIVSSRSSRHIVKSKRKKVHIHGLTKIIESQSRKKCAHSALLNFPRNVTAAQKSSVSHAKRAKLPTHP